MAESIYEKYVVRKPAIVVKVKDDEYIDVIPDTDEIPVINDVNTGPRVIISKKAVPDVDTVVEYGFITGDTVVGTGEDFVPHKHDYEEIFLFLGTNPDDTTDLGAEVEFYLGEGDKLDKVVFNKSSSVYVPAGLAHFPQVWKNVKRPVMTIVIMPTSGDKEVKPVSMEGRMK